MVVLNKQNKCTHLVPPVEALLAAQYLLPAFELVSVAILISQSFPTAILPIYAKNRVGILVNVIII